MADKGGASTPPLRRAHPAGMEGDVPGDRPMHTSVAHTSADVLRMTDAVEILLTAHGAGSAAVHDARLVVEEVACNAIEHAASAEAPLELQARVEDGRLWLQFRTAARRSIPPPTPAPTWTRRSGPAASAAWASSWSANWPNGSTTNASADATSFASPCGWMPPTTRSATHEHVEDRDLAAEQRRPAGGRRRPPDTHTYAELDQALAPVLADPAITSLVLDLAGLDYISSAGIRSVFKARKALAARNGKVLVVNPQPQIQKVFDMVKAVPLGEIFTSVAEADAYLDAMQRKMVEGDADS